MTLGKLKRKNMEATATDVTKKVTRRKKRKQTPEENRIPNSAKPAMNKYTEAALKHQGSFIVYDPHFML